MKNYIFTERTNLFEPNATITMKFTIIGQVESQKVKEAFEEAVKANETLNSKIVLSNNGDAWYEFCDGQRNCLNIMDKTWQEVLKEQQRILFQIDKGELIRGFFFPGKEQSEVLLLANHLAGDGKSIVYFIEQMMRALNNEMLPYQKYRTISVEEIPGKEKIPFYVKWFINYNNKKWKVYRAYFSMEDRCKIHHIYWNTNSVNLCVEHFSQVELAKIVAKAKSAQVSLTSYLIAAFCREIPGKISTGFAVDARLDKNRNMGNQTTGTNIIYKYSNKKNLAQNAQYIHTKLQKKISNNVSKYLVLYFLGKLEGTLIDSIYMCLSESYKNIISNKMVKVCGYGEFSKDLSLSNLTKLDIQNHYGVYEIKDFIFIPPYVSYGKRLIGVATLNNEMNITFQVKENEYTESEIERFREIIKKLK